MTKTLYFVLDYYNRQILERILEKYPLTPMEALRAYMTSETHALLEDAENGLTAYGEAAVFDMWEAEYRTGDPRNSVYLQGA